MKICQELHISLKSENNVRHFTWRCKNVYIVDSSTKYFVAQQKCNVTHSCIPMATVSNFILLTAICRLATIQRECICAFP